MSFVNDVRLMGFCADEPNPTMSRSGKVMATLSVYTNERAGETQIDQAHRCVFFGKLAKSILDRAAECSGRHIHIRGALRSKRIGDGESARYYTSILVEDYLLSPRLPMAVIKRELQSIEDEGQASSDER